MECLALKGLLSRRSASLAGETRISLPSFARTQDQAPQQQQTIALPTRPSRYRHSPNPGLPFARNGRIPAPKVGPQKKAPSVQLGRTFLWSLYTTKTDFCQANFYYIYKSLTYKKLQGPLSAPFFCLSPPRQSLLATAFCLQLLILHDLSFFSAPRKPPRPSLQFQLRSRRARASGPRMTFRHWGRYSPPSDL